MLDRILVPLDGSPVAATAVGFAALIPARTVALLRVERPSRDGVQTDDDRTGAAADALAEPAEYLRRHGREVEPLVRIGDPAEEILRAAGGCDLVVMTTRGMGAAHRAVFGSVADRVAHHARMPVLLLRGDERPTTEPRVSHVVVPLDGSERAEAALPVAIALAADLGVPMRLLRVVEADPVRDAVRGGPLTAAADAAAVERARQEARRYLDAAAVRVRNRDVVATGEVRTGYPVNEILAALSPGDLVAMASHGRGGVGRWLLGSVSDRLVREAPAPVLLVPARPA